MSDETVRFCLGVLTFIDIAVFLAGAGFIFTEWMSGLDLVPR